MLCMAGGLRHAVRAPSDYGKVQGEAPEHSAVPHAGGYQLALGGSYIYTRCLMKGESMQQLGLSSNTPPSHSRIRELLWPDVDHESDIKSVADRGMWVSFLIAGVTTFFAILQWVPISSILDAAMFVAIGFGIRKLSRTAAVLGFLLYGGGQLYMLSHGKGGYNLVLLVIFSAVFLSCIRATFAFHRIKKQKQIETPSITPT
jgi:hypothetical protein